MVRRCARRRTDAEVCRCDKRGMTRPPYISFVKPKTPAQPESDFTAEGSPPPGKVAREAPTVAPPKPAAKHRVPR